MGPSTRKRETGHQIKHSYIISTERPSTGHLREDQQQDAYWRNNNWNNEWRIFNLISTKGPSTGHLLLIGGTTRPPYGKTTGPLSWGSLTGQSTGVP